MCRHHKWSRFDRCLSIWAKNVPTDRSNKGKNSLIRLCIFQIIIDERSMVLHGDHPLLMLFMMQHRRWEQEPDRDAWEEHVWSQDPDVGSATCIRHGWHQQNLFFGLQHRWRSDRMLYAYDEKHASHTSKWTKCHPDTDKHPNNL